MKKSIIALGINAERITVKPVAIRELSETQVSLRQKFPAAGKIFLVLGRLDPVKNIPWLIRVFVEVIKNQPNHLLLIVGSGGDEGNIRNIIAKNKLEKNVVLEAWTNDPDSYLKVADCLLFPSLSEGYGLVAMEARAVGTPIIMNNVGVANYELKPSNTVKIPSINDKEKWIKAILNSF